MSKINNRRVDDMALLIKICVNLRKGRGEEGREETGLTLLFAIYVGLTLILIN